MEPLEIGLGGKIISLAALRLNTSLISSPDGKHINPSVKDGWFRVQAFRAFAFI